MKQTAKERAMEVIPDAFDPEEILPARAGYLVELERRGFMEGAEWQKKQFPWISVKERLPEQYENVLVLFEHNGTPIIQKDVYFGFGEIEWKFGEDKILAWMPIPSFDDILEANRDVLERIKEKGD